jgi:hypothetical protein
VNQEENLPDTFECATHPGVETSLRCGHCGKPVCPRCTIMTPGGQRCVECAQLRPPPMYEVSTVAKLKACGVAAGIGLAGGVLWALATQIRFLGFFVYLLAVGLGWLMGDLIGRVTNRKRGYVLQLIAGFGILFAYFVRNFMLYGVPVKLGDIYGYIAVAIAIIVAISPLR